MSQLRRIYGVCNKEKKEAHGKKEAQKTPKENADSAPKQEIEQIVYVCKCREEL
jgi:hypothetical protein